MTTEQWRLFVQYCREYAETLIATRDTKGYFHADLQHPDGHVVCTPGESLARACGKSRDYWYHEINGLILDHLPEESTAVGAMCEPSGWGWYCPLMVADTVEKLFL